MAGFGFGGLQFQPGVAQNGEKTGSGQRGRLQEPVQVLTTRLPKFFGGGAIAPAQLLSGAGGMGMPGAQGNVVAQALAQLAGLPPGMAPSGGSGAGGGSLSPMFGLPAGGGFSGSSTPPLPSYAPPPPVIRPGDERPPFPTPMPVPGPQPPPIREPQPPPPLPIGGRLPLPGTITDGGGSPAPGGSGEDDVIRLFASRLFR